MVIGIIGGTGFYDPALFTKSQEKRVKTKYGDPSDSLIVAEFKGKQVVILARHGREHTLSPSKVNYRANIDAMKQLGVSKLITISAVGSLKEDIKPGEFVFTDQFIDRTFGREKSFFETGKVGHIGVAEPFCPNLRNILVSAAKEVKIPYHAKGTCIVIEGPRFSTKAESMLYRSWGADTINMTLAPEVVLAREAEICYGNIAMVTDYDVWRDHHVSNQMVVETVKRNSENVKKLLTAAIAMVEEKDCECNHALDNAFF
jgi:5'-methylthioadenosine phosphorylase